MSEERTYSPEDVQRIAIYQKGIIVALAANLGLQFFVIIIGIPGAQSEVAAFAVLGLVGVLIATVLLALVFTFLLARSLHGTGIGVMLALTQFVPCVSLIVLLVLNAKATSVLRKSGLIVGLFGAKTP